MIGVTQQMHAQLIQRGKGLCAVGAGVLTLAMKGSNVLANDAVFEEDLAADGTRELAVHTVLVRVFLQQQHVHEALLADRALEHFAAEEVRLAVASQCRRAQEPLCALVAQIRLGFVRPVHQHMTLK